MADPPKFDPGAILRSLADHGVDHVVIGGIAAALHGADHVTTDIDITPCRDGPNAARLSAALGALDARVRIEGIDGGLPFDHDGPSLLRAGVWNLTTRHGDLDISFVPSGTQGWEDLGPNAVVIDLNGTAVAVASLEDVIRSKEAANRPKDRIVLPALRHLLQLRPR